MGFELQEEREEVRVSELIWKLLKLPPDIPVVVYDDGVPSEAFCVDLVTMEPDSNLEDLGFKVGDQVVVVG